MIWVNIDVPVIKIDRCKYRQSILDIVPIGLSMVITLCSLVPFIQSLFVYPIYQILWEYVYTKTLDMAYDCLLLLPAEFHCCIQGNLLYIGNSQTLD